MTKHCKNLVFCIYFEIHKFIPLKKPGFLYIFWKSQIDTLEKTWFFVYILNVANLHPWKNLVFCIYFEGHKLTPLKKPGFLYIFWKSQIDTIEKTWFFVYILKVTNWHPWKNVVFLYILNVANLISKQDLSWSSPGFWFLIKTCHGQALGFDFWTKPVMVKPWVLISTCLNICVLGHVRVRVWLHRNRTPRAQGPAS